MTNPLITPFGEIIVSIDNQEISYDAIPLTTHLTGGDQLLGRYAIFVRYKPDQLNHVIECRLKPNSDSKGYIESGERFLAMSFYTNDEDDILLIGVEGESDYYNHIRVSRYDYDVDEIENGVAYLTFPFTRTNFFPFVIAWIDRVAIKKHPDTAKDRLYESELSVEPCFIDKDVWETAYQKSTIYLLPSNLEFHTWLVGFKYTNTDINEINYGEELRLVQEPDNKYDSQAIRVENASGKKLGYISREINTYINHLIKDGFVITCRAEGVATVEGNDQLFLAIYKHTELIQFHHS